MDITASDGRLSAAARDFIARRHKLLIDGQYRSTGRSTR